MHSNLSVLFFHCPIQLYIKIKSLKKPLVTRALFFLILTLFYFTILYWFCHILTWIHHGCTWVPNHEPPSHYSVLPYPLFSSIQFSSSVVSDSLLPHGLQHNRLRVHHQLPELAQTHVQWVSEAIQPSYPLSSLLLLSSIFPSTMGREVGGGFMFGNACTPMVDSCQCMAKPIQYCKVKKKKIHRRTVQKRSSLLG